MVEFYLGLIAGVLLVGITAFDFFYTTLSFNGAGFINKNTTVALSSFFLLWHKHTSSRSISKRADKVSDLSWKEAERFSLNRWNWYNFRMNKIFNLNLE